MKKIIYFSPKSNRHVGGVKIIHRHSELINKIGGDSEVFYFFSDGNIDAVNWFVHNAVIKIDNVFNPQNDFVLLPESQIFGFWKELKNIGVEFGIFVQNGYLVANGIPHDEISQCYQDAKFIVCISEDAVRCIFQFFPQYVDKIIRVVYSIDTDLFKLGEKENIISYMPRKMKEHSSLLVSMLKNKIPHNWKIIPIENMSSDEVVQTLRKSRIFMAFSDFEGLPAPPVEAALCGNFVIGYTGQGGVEYWNEPIFQKIESGDIIGFMRAVLRKIDEITNWDIAIGENHQALLKYHFSQDLEIDLLRAMVDKINS